MFDGTIISKGESSLNEEEVDVEDDETTTYGPPQYVLFLSRSPPHNVCPRHILTTTSTGLHNRMLFPSHGPQQ